MATEVRKPAGRSSKRTIKIEDYVAQKLDVTRKQVRQVDTVSSLISLTAIVLIFLLAVAVIDAWILPLGSLARWLCFLLLLGGSVAWLVNMTMRYLRKINPDYAAQMIEDNQPSFKNSLLNYVSLSRRPQGTKSAVMDAVGRQAASDISTVPVETMVDRSELIRTGSILAAILLAVVAYKLFSPKDPFQSIARVLAPAAKLSAPSVVTIEDVDPGDTEAFFGDRVVVSATINGSHRPEDVQLMFSTEDGQIVDQAIPMVLQSGSVDRYQAELSHDGAGLQQSLMYRVVARDGTTPEYKVSVRTSPSITVKELLLEPPAYSGFEATTQQKGKIDAMEGTRVTVRARANLPIDRASIELLHAGDGLDDGYRTVSTISMNVDEDLSTAQGSFHLQYSARSGPKATHYRLKFASTKGYEDRNPNTYPITITPDLAPEIKVLLPAERSMELPLDRDLNIHVQASDTDFEISKVMLQFDRKGRRIFERPMKLTPLQGMKRVDGKFTLNVARQFPRVEPGDELIFFATAHDNKVATSGQLNSNQTRSENYVLKITPPEFKDNAADQPPVQPQDQQQDRPQDQQNDPEQKQQKQQQKDGDRNSNEPQERREEDPQRQQEKDPGDQQGQDSGEQEQREQEQREQQRREQQQPGDEGQQREPQDQGEREDSDPGEQKRGQDDRDQKGEGDQQERGDQRGDGGEQDRGQPQQGDSGQQGNDEGGAQEQEQGAGGDQPQGDQPSGNNQRGDGSGDRNDGGGDPNQENGGEQPAGQRQPAEQGAQGGQAEDSLDEGDSRGRQPLDEKASDAQRMRRLQERIEERQRQQQEQQGGSEQADQKGNSESGNDTNSDSDGSSESQQGSQQKSGDPKGSDPDAPGNPGNDGDSTAPEDNEQKQDAEGLSNPQGEPDGDQAPQRPQNNTGNGSEGEDDGKVRGNSGTQQGAESENGTSAEDSETGKGSPDGDGQPGEKDSSGEHRQPGSEPQEGDQQEGQPGQQEGQPGQQEGQPGQQEGQPGQQEGQPGQQEGQPGQQEGQPGQQEGQPGQQEGQPGQQEGQPGQQEGQPGQQEGQPGQQEGQPGQQEGQPGQQGQQPGKQQSQNGSKKGTPGGRPGSGTADEDLSEEQANLDYTKQAADLILEDLKNNRNNPDQELLDEMNWTKEDLNRFVDRWEQMKKKAESGNEADRKRFEKHLKALGLRPPSSRGKAKGKKDGKEDYREDSAVDKVMPDFLPQLRAFQLDQSRPN